MLDFHLFFWRAQQCLLALLGALTSMCKTSAQLRLENFALRQQLTVLRRSAPKRLQLTPADRLIGSIRRECLDHIIVLGERSLRRALASYVPYYHSWRTHLSLGKDAPQFRRTQACAEGKVVEIREVGGLHHDYERRAA